jgi:hypothetical protein
MLVEDGEIADNTMIQVTDVVLPRGKCRTM